MEKALNKKRTANLIFRYSFQRTNLYNIIIPAPGAAAGSARAVLDCRSRVRSRHSGQSCWMHTAACFNRSILGLLRRRSGPVRTSCDFLDRHAFYKQVKPWLVWANDFRLGLAKPFSGSEVPLSGRFFTGGADSLRGFPINGAGPQRPVPVCSNPADQSTCTLISVPEGGDMLFIFNSEARFPLPFREGLGAVLFYDGGNVYSNINLRQFADNFTHSVGVGIRYKTPVGPIRFDVGYRITTVPGVGTTQYFVSLGNRFDCRLRRFNSWIGRAL